MHIGVKGLSEKANCVVGGWTLHWHNLNNTQIQTFFTLAALIIKSYYRGYQIKDWTTGWQSHVDILSKYINLISIDNSRHFSIPLSKAFMTSGLNEALCGCLLESLSKHKGLDFIKSGSYPHTLTYFTWWLRGALNQFGEIWDNVLSTDS